MRRRTNTCTHRKRSLDTLVAAVVAGCCSNSNKVACVRRPPTDCERSFDFAIVSLYSLFMAIGQPMLFFLFFCSRCAFLWRENKINDIDTVIGGLHTIASSVFCVCSLSLSNQLSPVIYGHLTFELFACDF